MDSLEQDALEVLSLVRSLKNSIAPINRIPPEVLSLVPDYRSGKHMDRDLIALTHVCRSWRETFTSRSSLWTRLPLKDTDKTRAYIQRSKCSPLKISLHADDGLYRAFRDAIPLIIPNIRRFQTLFVRGETPPDALKHFCCHTPLLEELDVSISGPGDLVLDSALFNGDLSSLRKLTLGGVITQFPWKNMASLRVVSLKGCVAGHPISRLRPSPAHNPA
ncbi:hypothetical protein BJ322DRAFT_441531 [Thelephora terrestris]|uniref:F-box domain-containing protein n=1 Tax=Thelephora terrestris TaxID=56493 RepID=A0A9P6HNG6_9AGAM|nr:hypothetical protein BJ322DRAFT_441531 [Thelephora terrestris]